MSMQLSVNVHGAQVQSVRRQGDVVVVDLGDRGAGVGVESVRLFLDREQLLALVVDLVDDADAAWPGFLLRVLDGLTG